MMYIRFVSHLKHTLKFYSFTCLEHLKYSEIKFMQEKPL